MIRSLVLLLLFFSFPAAAQYDALPDAQRQAHSLELAYQAKVYGQARRIGNTMALGFANVSGIGSSLNCSIDAANKRVVRSSSNPTMIPQGTGTIIGDLLAHGAGSMSVLFDGNGNQDHNVGAQSNSGNIGFFGKNYSAAPQKVSHAVLYAPNDTGFNGSSNSATLTQRLYGSQTAPTTATATSGTLLATSTSESTIGQIVTLTSTDQTTAFAYSWAVVSGGSTSQTDAVEVQFWTPGSAGDVEFTTTAIATDATVSNGRVTMEIEPGAYALTDVSVEITANGTNWTAAPLSLVTVNGQGGRSIVETADVSLTAGSALTARTKVLNGKVVPIHALILAGH